MYVTPVVFLAANTPRSKAYAQAIQHAGLRVDKVVLYGFENETQTGLVGPESWVTSELFLPDLRQPLQLSLAAIADRVVTLTERDLNAPAVAQALFEDDPKLVIFSGFGGQIVPRELLENRPPMLHMHAGWLPEFRGSTTTYYSLLEEQRCGVSALFLSPEIDMGRIVKRKHFALPPAGTDIDYLLDGAMRADVLVAVLCEWYDRQDLRTESQDEGSGRMYYVIHPLLKHLAIVSLPQRNI